MQTTENIDTITRKPARKDVLPLLILLAQLGSIEPARHKDVTGAVTTCPQHQSKKSAPATVSRSLNKQRANDGQTHGL